MKTNAAMQGKEMSVEEEKIQGGVQSLEVGLTVLDALTAHNAPMMLKELSEVLSMHPAKVHRYVVSLIRKGYAQQLTDGRYSLGERAHAFGVNALKRTDMLELSQRYIQDIQQHLNCSIHVSKWFADGAVVVSLDGDKEQIVNINGHYKGELGKWQAEHVIVTNTLHHVDKKEKHTLRIRPLDPALVLQKVMIDFGGMKPSFLGAPESLIK
jgi:predicted transcriptional regulator